MARDKSRRPHTEAEKQAARQLRLNAHLGEFTSAVETLDDPDRLSVRNI